VVVAAVIESSRTIANMIRDKECDLLNIHASENKFQYAFDNWEERIVVWVVFGL